MSTPTLKNPATPGAEPPTAIPTIRKKMIAMLVMTIQGVEFGMSWDAMWSACEVSTRTSPSTGCNDRPVMQYRQQYLIDIRKPKTQIAEHHKHDQFPPMLRQGRSPDNLIADSSAGSTPRQKGKVKRHAGLLSARLESRTPASSVSLATPECPGAAHSSAGFPQRF
jgi:hypothetical protein